MSLYSFEKLEVWQLAKALTVNIYKLSENLPKDEKYGIISQLRRASFSVANNLAEGTSRNSDKEKVRFIEMSFGSLMEVLNILLIAKELELIGDKDLLDLRPKIEEIGNKMNALKNAISRSTK